MDTNHHSVKISETTEEMTISPVSKTDEGSYKCKFGEQDSAESKERELRVEANTPKATLRTYSSTIPVGGRVTLTCSVEGSSGWKYYWYRQTTDPEALIMKDGAPNLNRDISVSEGGLYRCRGGRGDPVFFTHGSDAKTIDKIVTNRAVVTLQPNWPQIHSGETITLRCEIDGGDTEWEYEWRTTNSYKPPKQNEYRISSAYTTHSGNYSCQGRQRSDLYSSTEWSYLTTLTVSSRRPKAKLSADKTAIPVGGSVTLTCYVQESSGWKYYWYRKEKDSEPLTTQDDDPNSNKISVSQEGLYWCRGARGDSVYYTEYSNSIHIGKNVANRAVVTLQPNWPQIYSGETITLRCEIQGGGDTEWEYEWRTTNPYKPPKQNEYRISGLYISHSGEYQCKGRQRSGQQSSTEWSSAFKLTVSCKSARSVLTVSPVWLSPGASVTLSCEVKGSSAGWRFYWYKAVPKLSDNSYTYELLPGSNDGTAEGSYILHGPTHTGGYMCRAGRGDPVFYTRNSEPKFICSGDRRSSASVTVSPNRTQHFSSESVSLSCEGNSTEWRVKRFTEGGYLTHCSSNWGSMTGSKCNITNIQFSAVYWCESGSGEFSNAVNITGQYGSLILVSPVHPVTEGDSVTLGCKSRTGPLLSNVDFYQNDKLIQNENRGEMTIHAVSKSDEGFYKCKYSRTESPQSWMAVKVAVSRPASSPFLVWLIIGLVTVILLIILLLLCCYRKSKDPCCGRPIQSQSTNQGSTTDQREDQENGQTVLHGDAYVYESIKGSEDTENGGPAGESSDITYSSIELKNVHKKGKHVDPAESSVYSDVKIGSTTEESNVTYAQVYHQNKGKAKDNKELSTPAEIQDTVYSEVKAGTTLEVLSSLCIGSGKVCEKQSDRVAELDVRMGRTSLCVLVLFLLSTLLYHGHAQDAVLTLEPNWSHVFTGESVTFICDMREGQDTDWWYKINKDGQEFVSYSPSKRYTFQSLTGNSGEYQCIGTHNRYTYHKKESNKVTLTVSDGDVILESPAFALFVGESVTLRCRLRIQGNANRASFYRDGSLVEMDTNHHSVKISETTEEMTISPVSETDEGSYKCKFGEQDGAESKERELRVEANTPKATLRTDSSAIPVGGRVTLTCSVEGSSGWKYYWYRQTTDPEALIMEDGAPNLNKVISVSEGGLYRCRGGRGDPVFFTQYSDTITIDKIVGNRPVVTLQPNWPQIYIGEIITLRCGIQEGGHPEWEYEWRTSSSNKPLKQAAYRIVRASLSDSGDYSCQGRQRSDLYSSTEWSYAITLTVSSGRPKATLSADKTAIPVGGSVTLTCYVQESSGWKYYWYRKEKDSEPLTTQDDDPNSNENSVSQEGLYWCRGVRGDSVFYTEYSDSIHIGKNVANRAVVTLQPNWPQIYSGETITLKCEIEGQGDTEWEYEWRTSSSHKPQKQNEYRISSAYTTHSGDYECKGRQRSGQQSSTEWSSAFKLTVSCKSARSVLTISPVWLSPGASVTLSCEVEGSSAGWRFYWYKAVPKLSDNSYTYELLPGSNDGTAEGSYILHGPTHTGGYMCRAGRGDPVFYTDDSEPKFIWSGDRRSSASVTVSPNRTQHFSSESVSLSCEGNSTEWRVKRFTEAGYLTHCSSNWGSVTGSKCNINSIRSSAVYWCESGSGEFSNAVNITVQYGSLILVSPVHLVTEGDSVTLGCKSRTGPLRSNVDFYRNDKLIQNETRGEMTIHAVSKSDEGFYQCKYSEYPGTESLQSWMAVKFAVSRPASSSFLLGLIIGLVTVILLIVLLLLLCCYRKSRDCT
ncbi:basement membrane-specific heparan sulfate proteoglycan core protein-like [Centroberyx affinis]|uniref:basement membrane-specific heparan sulfate proteoglycan core protein-like n=1 Tax=Centroberyx affinis TaxID=166261 RepID=UPI003A5C3B11